jgi:prolipoprotein diacylglyceryltransferase
MFTQIGPWTVHTFTLYLSLAMALSLALAGFMLHQTVPLAALGNALTGAVFLGLLLARIEYALLNWEVFAATPLGVLRGGAGGLSWHGGFIGALLGLWLGARLSGISVVPIVAAAAPAPGLLAFATWTGCRIVGCAYGVEVETLAYYPAWAVTEGRDIYGLLAPRYDTHTYGQVAALLLIIVVGGWWARRGASPALTWGGLAALAGATAAIGAFRGDPSPTVIGLRVDQMLDIAVALVAAAMFVRSRRLPTRFRRSAPERRPTPPPLY